MKQPSSPAADIGLGVVLILVALLTIYGTLELPEGSFEPLGSASIPQYVSGGIIFLSLWVIARAVWKLRSEGVAWRDPRTAAFRHRYDYAVALVVLSCLYVFVMAMDWVRFSVATLVFILVTVGLLSGFARRTLPIVLALAIGLGIGLEYLFTQVFVIDLP